MGFGKIFSDSWKDYKRNFKSIVWVMLLYTLAIWILAGTAGIFDEMEVIEFGPFVVLWTVIVVLVFLLMLWISGALVATVVKRKKFSFSQAFLDIRGKYLAFVLFCVVVTLFLVGLYILLIIPGIIFSIYWILAPYVFFAEKKGIISSLKTSFRLVKKRWWRTFGYSILFFLIYFGIALGFGSVATLFGSIFSLTGYEALTGIISSVINSLSNFITIPLSILFYKNLYFAMKSKKF